MNAVKTTASGGRGKQNSTEFCLQNSGIKTVHGCTVLMDPHFSHKNRDFSCEKNNERAEYSQKSVKKESA